MIFWPLLAAPLVQTHSSLLDFLITESVISFVTSFGTLPYTREKCRGRAWDMLVHYQRFTSGIPVAIMRCIADSRSYEFFYHRDAKSNADHQRLWKWAWVLSLAYQSLETEKAFDAHQNFFHMPTQPQATLPAMQTCGHVKYWKQRL